MHYFVNNNLQFEHIPQEKFAFVQQDKKIYDKKLETKPIGYFKDAWLRFKKDKSAVIAMWLIILLLLFAIIVPEVSNFNVLFRDGYYKNMLPKNDHFAGTGFWDGTTRSTENQAGYDYLNAIGVETKRPVIVDEFGTKLDSKGNTLYDVLGKD